MHGTDEPGAALRAGEAVFERAEIEAALAEAELIPLLLTVASMKRDPELLRAAFRPALLTPSVGALTQGGLAPDAVRELRALLVEELAAMRAEDLVPRPLSDDFLSEALDFMTGERRDDYLPILRRELGWTGDAERPAPDLDAAAPKRVAIIGSGISGVAMAVRLRHAGVEFVLFEKNDSIGGTWYENRYPGCRLDTSNFGYSYSFAQTNWRHYFSTQEEIRAYLERVAEDEGILPSIRFGTEVRSLEWTGESWRLRTDTTEESFDFVVSAVGQLNRPKIPDLPGLDEFAGEYWHSATWPEGRGVDGQRVGIIGTGASAYQIAPAISENAEHVTVFQRTPPWMIPTKGYSSALPEAYSALIEALPGYRRWLRFFQFWVSMDGRMRFTQADPEWDVPGSVSAVNAEFREVLEASLREQFGDRPELLAAVTPSYPPGSKRILRDDGGWARTLHRDDVELVTDGIERFTERGIVLASGREVELDVAVFATGFHADRFLSPMTVIGEGGVSLSEVWGDRAETYLGMSVPGFPNFAILYGPNTNLVVNGSLVFLIECAVHRVLEMIGYVADNGLVGIDVPAPVVDRFVAEVDAANESKAWGDPRVVNWYKGASGRVVSVWPLSMQRFWELSHQDDLDGWRRIAPAHDGELEVAGLGSRRSA